MSSQLTSSESPDCLGINLFPGVAGYREPKLEKLTGCVGVSILKQDQAWRETHRVLADSMTPNKTDTEQGWDSEVRGNTGKSTVF